MKKKSIVLLSMMIMFFLSSQTVFALNALTTLPLDSSAKEKSTFQVGVAAQYLYIHGQLKEFVFNPAEDRMISKLVWDELPLIYTGFVGYMQILEIFTIKAGIWTGINSRLGEIEDFDWIKTTSTRPTHYSKHDCLLDEAFAYDLNGGFNLIRKNRLRLNLNIGFQYRLTQVYANDGYVDYPIEDGGYRQSEGRGITYRQKFYIPYAGIQLGYNLKNGITISTYLTYTPKTIYRGKDIHHHESIAKIFYDSANSGNSFSLGTSFSYSFHKNIGIALGLAYFKIAETKATTYYYDIETKTTSTPVPTGAGVSVDQFSITLEIRTGFSLGKAKY